MTEYHDTAKEIADLVSEKNEAYGNSFELSEKILSILYPNGIKVEQYKDVLTITRMIDKMFRIATKKDAFGEDPYKDILGYALLAVTQNKNKKNPPKSKDCGCVGWHSCGIEG